MSPTTHAARQLAAAASFLLAGIAPAVASAQQASAPAPQPASQPAMSPAMAPAMAAPSTAALRSEIVAAITDAQDKLVALAEAMPAAKYSWRPAKGVRSVGELFVHVAGGNYMLPPMAGVAASPFAPPENAEKTITSKAKIVELLKQSFAYARQSVMDVPDDQMDVMVNMFGRQASKRSVLLGEATHVHEHLGQAIAYARSNGVVPPWSRPATAPTSTAAARQ